MLAAVTGRAAKKPRGEAGGVRIQSRQQIVSEACPESEFSLNPGAASTGEGEGGGGEGLKWAGHVVWAFKPGCSPQCSASLCAAVYLCRSLPGCA